MTQNNKQKLVIKPKSIRVPQQFDTSFPVSEQSVFSDGYDWEAERKRLEAIAADGVDSSHPDAEALAVLAGHEMLLKQHILRQRIRNGQKRSRSLGSVNLDDYAVYLSEDKIFDEVGTLAGSEDAFELHTKQGIRIWEGKNDKKTHRWPGIRYGMALSGELVRAAKADNPFAHAELLAFETELDTVSGALAAETDKMQQMLEQYRATGIHIGVFANAQPVLIKTSAVRGYGFRLLQLLTAYDYLVRLAKTMGLKGLMSNTASNDVIHECGKKIRVLLQGLYTSAMKIRQIQSVSRTTLLEDAVIAEKLGVAVANGVLPPLQEDVLLYRRMPAFTFVDTVIPPKRQSELYEAAVRFGLTEILSQEQLG